MSTTDSRLPSHNGFARRLAHDLGFQSEAAQLRARSTLTELLGEAPAYRWTYIAPRVARNAAAALLDLQQIALQDPLEIPSYSSEALSYAYVWESLATLQEASTRKTALLNAAAAYDLAGYEANAVCLARGLVPRIPELSDVSGDIDELASLFLQRLFLLVSIAAKRLVTEPNVDEMQFEDMLRAAGRAVFADGLRSAALAFLGGDQACLNESAVILQGAERIYTEIGAASEANHIRLLRSLLPVMWQRATWTHLGTHHQDHPLWRRYLKLLARGMGKRILVSSSVSELWPSQIVALDAGLLDSQSSKVIRMPTSAGKTRVAELAIVDALVREPGARCVYVAPFRALVSEVEQTFAALLGDLGFRVSSILGTYESDEFERLLTEDADLIVVTPEKLDLLLRLKSDFLSHVRLIVLDEGHLINDLARGAKFELLLTRLKLTLQVPRFLVLSAVVPDQTLTDFANWLNAGDRGIITSTWRPSVQRVAALEWGRTTGVLRYTGGNEDALLREFVPGIIRQRSFAYENPDTQRINRRRFPDENNKGQIAAALAAEFADIGSVLIFTPIPRNAVSVAKALAYRLDLLKRTGEPVPAYYRTPDTRSAQVAAEWLGEDHDVTNLLRTGIAVHHGQLPNAVRAAIETDFRERRYRLIVATSTLAQGVNLPLRTVIIHSCWRSTANSRVRIAAREYWNIAGRAGRARDETQGTVIHLVVTPQDRRDYRDYLELRDNVEPVESALLQALVAIAENRFTEAALGEALDAEILAMAVEETARPDIGDFGSILAQSLVAVQASDRKIALDPVVRAFTGRQQYILQHVDADMLPIYSATGLSSDSCEHMRSHVMDHVASLSELLTVNSPNYADLTDLLLDGTTGIDEMQPDSEYPGDTRGLFTAWLEGMAIDQLRSTFASPASPVEDLTRFIEEFFGYLLPWGFSGYLRIAAKALNIEEPGLGARFFPSMVMYGVPVPEAAWAMAAGVPIRRVGIALASQFIAQAETSSGTSFLDWLGRVDYETLRLEYGLSGPILEDVARALRRAGRNPLLTTDKEVADILPITIEVRGVSYGNRRLVAHRTHSGQQVTLEREYDNLVDQNAVRVFVDSDELGHLPRDVAQLLAPELDVGLAVSATVAATTDGEIPRVTVTLSIAEQ